MAEYVSDVKICPVGRAGFMALTLHRGQSSKYENVSEIGIANYVCQYKFGFEWLGHESIPTLLGGRGIQTFYLLHQIVQFLLEQSLIFLCFILGILS